MALCRDDGTLHWWNAAFQRLGEPTTTVKPGQRIDRWLRASQTTALSPWQWTRMRPGGEMTGEAACGQQWQAMAIRWRTLAGGAVVFYIDPIAPAPATPTAVHPPAAEPPLRLLLADDNRVNQRVALLILQRLGYDPTIASGGREVLQHLRDAPQEAPYDAILMDVDMPDLDGLATTRAIRAGHAGPVSPYIVAVTAYATAADRQRCLEAGMDEHLSKPLREEALRRVLRQAREGGHRLSSGSVAIAAAPAPDADRAINTGDNADDGGPMFDRQILDDLQRMAGKRAQELLAAILDQYYEDSPKRLGDLEASLLAGHTDGVRRAAHALRSSSANLGAVRLMRLAETVETCARTGKTSELTVLVPKIRDEYEMVVAHLQSSIALGDQ